MLNQAKRRRLVQLLGMLGSAHDGERANAARFADQLLREHGLGWDQIIGHPTQSATTTSAAQPAPAARPAPEPAADSWHGQTNSGWRAVSQACLAGDLKLLTVWEEEFLKDILHRWRGRLTERQQTIVDGIAERMGVIDRHCR